jgi:DNA-binding MarR family transcriptional regulator
MAKATQPVARPLDARTTAGIEALFGLLHIQSHVVRQIDEALDRAHGAGLSGFELLSRLERMHPDGASVRYLAEQVVVSPSRVSRLADEFVARGWLERAVSPHDGRLSLVRLTDDGRQSLQAMRHTLGEAVQTHFLDQLSSSQLSALVAICRALGAPHC